MQGIITSILTAILGSLSKEKFNSIVDGLLDVIEEKVKATPNKIDDAVVLPLCTKVRELLDVNDD